MSGATSHQPTDSKREKSFLPAPGLQGPCRYSQGQGPSKRCSAVANSYLPGCVCTGTYTASRSADKDIGRTVDGNRDFQPTTVGCWFVPKCWVADRSCLWTVCSCILKWMRKAVIGCGFEMKRTLGLRGDNLWELGTEGVRTTCLRSGAAFPSLNTAGSESCSGGWRLQLLWAGRVEVRNTRNAFLFYGR